ncbi:SRPBCC family protein [Gordonia sp. SID5947]|uniref:type II toxin-antitoxin system Rv0910 family toxin n=1 Tax=Gordonia sp. SID5947 TaxID=2690315 RepID=UPI00136F809F|nr:SRPBCC family protein [Gordonia sp. SID5947]MYR05471.1 SRPBCC family protein [Gordonia sp. SID5947]
MAGVEVEVDSDMSPTAAWELASDLGRFSEWMTIFGGWRSDLPSRIGEGTEVSSLIKVKGFRNIIHWRVTEYVEPEVIALAGRGRGGVRIDLTMKVTPAESGSHFGLHADLSGGLLNGPVGRLVARVIESDVRASINNLAGLS